MSDLLNPHASITGVLLLAGKLTVLIHKYIVDVMNAPETIRRLVDELQSFSNVLEDLQVCVDSNPGSLTLQKLGGRDGLLQKCTQDLEALLSKLANKPDGFGWKAKVGKLTWSLKERNHITEQIIGKIAWPLNQRDALKQIAALERHKSQISLMLANCQLDIANYIAQKQDAEHIARKREAALNWLFADSFKDRHLEISARRRKNTGDWLLRTPEMKDWTGDRSNSLLFGHGIPGAGKTFLSSAVIDHVEARADVAEYGLAYVYFNYKEQDQQTPANVLRSLIKQLAYRISDLPQEIATLYNKFKERKKEPTLDQLLTAAIAISKQFSRTFFIFDALDECDINKQRKILLPLFHLIGEGGINIFLTSRSYPQDIRDSFKDWPQIKLKATEEDIRNYIRAKIDENPQAKRLILRGDCQEKIISELVECAKGMFLLVHFHIEHICQQTTPGQILRELRKLKESSTGERSLYPTYDRAIQTIREQGKPRAELALRILSWLTKTKRVLEIEELRTAVSIEAGNYELSELDLPDKMTMLDVCAGLAVIDENTSQVRLAHYTVQEYLLQEQSIIGGADLALATACTTYLSFDIFTDPTNLESYRTHLRLPRQPARYPLLSYAAENLISHLKSCDEEQTHDMTLRFLQHTNNRAFYLAACNNIRSWSRRHPDRLPALHLACILGHMTVTQLLIFKEVSLVDGEYGYSALHCATREGNYEVVRLLLEEGADVLRSDKRGAMALHHAAKWGEKEVVQLLLDKGANISSPGANGMTALHHAAKWENIEVARLLLEKDADTSIQDKSGKTALHHAAEWGKTEVIQLLLKKGADVSIREEKGMTALHSATTYGNKEVVWLLLGKGADVSIRDEDGMAALHHAATYENKEVVQLLLDRGADISSPDKNGLTALHHAATYGNKEVVQLLLDRGADFLSPDKNGMAALNHATTYGNKEVVRLLLDKGADVSSPGKCGMTSLHYAAARGNKEMIQLILDKGANVLIADDNGMTALHHAIPTTSAGPDCSIAQEAINLLLEKGADISAINNYGQTVLHYAVNSRGDFTGFTERFLDVGANISTLDNHGRTALHIAARYGKEKNFRVLLGRGADITIRDKLGETVFGLAASAGHRSILMLSNPAMTISEAEEAIKKAKAKPATHLVETAKGQVVAHGVTETVGNDNPSSNQDLIGLGSSHGETKPSLEEKIRVITVDKNHPSTHITHIKLIAFCLAIFVVFFLWWQSRIL